MERDFSKESFAAYHAAVFEALGEDGAKYNAKIGAILANAWQRRLKELPADSAEMNLPGASSGVSKPSKCHCEKVFYCFYEHQVHCVASLKERESEQASVFIASELDSERSNSPEAHGSAQKGLL